MKQIICLLLISFSAPIFANANGKVSIIVTPARKYLDFTSPRSMFLSFGQSYLSRTLGASLAHRQKSGMGHVVAHIDCTDSDGNEQSFYTGISGQYSQEQDNLDIFEDQIALGVLFRGYRDGHVQASKYVKYLIGENVGRVILDARRVPKRMAPKFISFEVTPKQCSEIMQFHQVFKDKKFGEPPSYEEYVTMRENEPLYFNFVMDPYETYQNIRKNNLDPSHSKIGAVCSSFAAGLLKVAGLFQPIFEKKWKVDFQVGESLIGKPEIGHRVSLFDVLKRKQWVQGGEPSRRLRFYHPEYLWSFFQGVEDCLQYQKKGKFCTNEILAWSKSNHRKLKIEDKTIKYQKEVKSRAGVLEKIDKKRLIKGIHLSL